MPFLYIPLNLDSIFCFFFAFYLLSYCFFGDGKLATATGDEEYRWNSSALDEECDKREIGDSVDGENTR